MGEELAARDIGEKHVDVQLVLVGLVATHHDARRSNQAKVSMGQKREGRTGVGIRTYSSTMNGCFAFDKMSLSFLICSTCFSLTISVFASTLSAKCGRRGVVGGAPGLSDEAGLLVVLLFGLDGEAKMGWGAVGEVDGDLTLTRRTRPKLLCEFGVVRDDGEGGRRGKSQKEGSRSCLARHL
jgi:hypothetical protein